MHADIQQANTPKQNRKMVEDSPSKSVWRLQLKILLLASEVVQAYL